MKIQVSLKKIYIVLILRFITSQNKNIKNSKKIKLEK